MKIVDIRVHDTPEPVLLRITLPPRKAGAGTQRENYGPTSPPIISTVLALHLEVRDARAPGRPVKVNDDAVVALLGDDGATYAEWKKMAAEIGCSTTTFKRRRTLALALGLVVERSGKYFQTGPELTEIENNSGPKAA